MALKVVPRLKDLAANEANREVICKDKKCLPGLVTFLANEDEEVRTGALDVLLLLSMSHANREIISQEPGLMKALEKVTQSASQKMKNLAFSIQNNIQATATPKRNQTSPLAQRNRNIANNTNATEKKTRAQTYTLYFSGLTSEKDRTSVEQTLVRIKGVVSFLIDLFNQKAVVRSLTNAETLVETIIKETGFCTSLTPFEVVPDETVVATEMPGYLEEEEEEEMEENGPQSLAVRKSPTKDTENNATWGWGLGRIGKALWG